MMSRRSVAAYSPVFSNNMNAQICEIAGFLYTGLLLGAVYGVLDIILSITSAKRWIVHIIDFFYMCICFAVCALAFYILTYGKVSLIYVTAILAGIFIYTKNMHCLIKEIVHID